MLNPKWFDNDKVYEVFKKEGKDPKKSVERLSIQFDSFLKKEGEYICFINFNIKLTESFLNEAEIEGNTKKYVFYMLMLFSLERDALDKDLKSAFERHLQFQILGTVEILLSDAIGDLKKSQSFDKKLYCNNIIKDTNSLIESNIDTNNLAEELSEIFHLCEGFGVTCKRSEVTYERKDLRNSLNNTLMMVYNKFTQKMSELEKERLKQKDKTVIRVS